MAGRVVETAELLPIRDPFTGETVAETCLASRTQVAQAVEAAAQAFATSRRLSAFARSRLLAAMVAGITSRRAEFVDRIIEEAGKPRMLAEVEVARAIQTFTLASEEVRRFNGELVATDLDAAGRAFAPARVRWVPRGPVLAITPFNFPLNLAAHKVAPALAVGASVVLKPPPQAPGASFLMADCFEAARAQVSQETGEDIPAEMLQVLHGMPEALTPAITDPRLAVLSFTGSDRVGWLLQSQAVRKKVCLELGGNASVIVHEDADLPRAAKRAAFGAFSYSGQVCISVQRIFVQQKVEEAFRQVFLKEVGAIRAGDPQLPDTLVGPVIDAGNAERVLQWIEEARKAGAQVLAGGTRQGPVVAPTVLAGTRAQDRVRCEEVFGPVVTLEPYTDFEEALRLVNDSRFGLQAGVFTQSLALAERAISELDVGGVLINEIPTYRADHLPYGGMRDSGLGREGVRYAMEDFCERKTALVWIG